MSDSFLELRNLKKSFTSEEYVLQGINLQIDQGEFVTLLGASGCGKTTTLRIIAGLEQPDSGSVWLEGKDVTNLEPNQRDVNTVFQNYALFPHMNVADNIGYGLKIRKVPKADIKKKVKEMLELVQLAGNGDRLSLQLIILRGDFLRAVGHVKAGNGIGVLPGGHQCLELLPANLFLFG